MLLTAPQTKAEELPPKERVAASFRSGSGRDGRALPPLPVPPAAPGLRAHRGKGISCSGVRPLQTSSPFPLSSFRSANCSAGVFQSTKVPHVTWTDGRAAEPQRRSGDPQLEFAVAAAVPRSEARQAEAAAAGAQRGALPVRARRPLRCPDPAARSLRPGHLFVQTARTWAAGRAPGTYIQAVEAAVHAQSHRTAPRSQAVAAVAAAPLAVTPLAAAPNTPRPLWRDAFLYGPRLSPAPGAAGSGSSPAMPPRSRAPGGRLGPLFVCRPGHGNCTCPARPRGPRSSRGHLPPSDWCVHTSGLLNFPSRTFFEVCCGALGCHGYPRRAPNEVTGPGVVWRRKSRGPVCHSKFWQLCPQSCLFPPAEERQEARAGPYWGMRGSINFSRAAMWVGCRLPSELLWQLWVWVRSRVMTPFM